MIYGRPVIQILNSLDIFFKQLVPRTVEPPADTDWRAKKLKEFIDQDQVRIRWRLGDACKQLGFPISDRQARRLFRNSVGVGIKEYSRSRRLARAAEQLRATSVPVKVIAADAGYQNTRNFARRFKQLFHLRPMEFRRVWRQREIAA
jgi:methylphosphotriester-DNA--protein-cysteine methyltransferase